MSWGSSYRSAPSWSTRSARTTHRGSSGYWHARFASKRKGGEWFDLDKEDVASFRKRSLM